MPQTSYAAAETARLTLSPRLVRLLVVGLLVVLAVLLFASVRQESQVFDESMHLLAGFEYWKRGDFGRNPEHPPLAKMVATIPLLGMGLKEPAPVPVPFFKAQDAINGGQFLYSGGANADAILIRGRMAMALFSVTLGAGVSGWARDVRRVGWVDCAWAVCL